MAKSFEKKSTSNKTSTQVKKQPVTHFLSGLMKVKDQYLECGHFRVNSGAEIRFWKDTWIGDKPLVVYPNLYHIVRKKDDTVAKGTTPLNVSFQRALKDDTLID